MGITGRYQVLRGLRVLQGRKVLVPCVQESTRIRFVSSAASDRCTISKSVSRIASRSAMRSRSPCAIRVPSRTRSTAAWSCIGGEHAGEIEAEVRPPAAEELCGEVAAHRPVDARGQMRFDRRVIQVPGGEREGNRESVRHGRQCQRVVVSVARLVERRHLAIGSVPGTRGSRSRVSDPFAGRPALHHACHAAECGDRLAERCGRESPAVAGRGAPRRRSRRRPSAGPPAGAAARPRSRRDPRPLPSSEMDAGAATIEDRRAGEEQGRGGRTEVRERDELSPGDRSA